MHGFSSLRSPVTAQQYVSSPTTAAQHAGDFPLPTLTLPRFAPISLWRPYRPSTRSLRFRRGELAAAAAAAGRRVGGQQRGALPRRQPARPAPRPLHPQERRQLPRAPGRRRPARRHLQRRERGGLGRRTDHVQRSTETRRDAPPAPGAPLPPLIAARRARRRARLPPLRPLQIRRGLHQDGLAGCRPQTEKFEKDRRDPQEGEFGGEAVSAKG